MQQQVDTLQTIINKVVEFFVNYSFQVVGALIILIAGWLLANWSGKLMMKSLQKKNFDITLAKFLTGIVRILILAFAIIIALGKFGITIAPFVAALGALTFGASFAIQGPLSNYGAGLSIILSRPFVVGDTITVAGENGIVQEVKLACTVLTDEDGIRITIPNKKIVGEILRNSKSFRIVEGSVGISYSDDPEKGIRAVIETLKKFEDVAKDPQPQVGIQEFADSSINIGYRFWIPTARYFQVSYAINLALYKAVAQAGLTMPYPQRDIHIVSQTSTPGASVPVA